MMRTLLLAFVLLAGFASPAFAHEKGVIHLRSKSLPVGGELAIRGEKLPKSAPIRLELRGSLETYPLGEVRTDAKGAFQYRQALPAEAGVGDYAVVALASDGDQVARADLTLTSAPAPAMEGMEGMEHAADMPGPLPTAEMMKVPVSTTGVEWAAIVAIIGLSLAGGVALLAGGNRRPV